MFVKTHKDSLTPVITHLINLSFEGNVFPTAWKKAIVAPIFKSGDNYEVSNYRPISILPVFSKVAEKIVLEQLTSHLNTIEAGLHCMQFGFRVNYSTETATLHLIEQIKSKVDKGGFVGTIFLDLRKAFDTVNHTVLLSKLSTFQFSSEALAWVSSYLSNREQCVKIKWGKSCDLHYTMGVPQGSVLGPLLFSLYINDLPQQCEGIQVQMYADDTVIFTYAKTAESAAEKLKAATEKITQWLEQSCLSLNISKTKGFFFSKTNVKPPDVDICINGEKIEIVNEFNYLGIILDSNLSFKKHIKKMVRNIKHNMANFRQIRQCLSFDVAKALMYATFFAHMSYCLTCWGKAGDTVIKPLKSLNKQALKILDKKNPTIFILVGS
uniref:Reverse transcriptase domain-containing protein n=1 Tax=Cyprinus carpio TaxID=7962 RepID=A0A8C1JD21_CYPCA